MSGRRPEQDWFEKTEKDLVMARRAMDSEGPIPEMACYHAQQCAEKHLKGYLVSQKLAHELRCMMEQFTKPVEGQHDGQATAAAHGSLQVPSCVGSG